MHVSGISSVLSLLEYTRFLKYQVNSAGISGGADIHHKDERQVTKRSHSKHFGRSECFKEIQGLFHRLSS